MGLSHRFATFCLDKDFCDTMRTLLLICVFGVVVGCQPEPSHQGKPLFVWRQELDSPDPMARLHAVAAFSTVGVQGKAAIPDLIRLLHDDYSYVRSEACIALGHMGSEASDAIPQLKELLKDKEPSVRAQAANAIKKIDPTVVVQEQLDD
jgi:hypothetical protein